MEALSDIAATLTSMAGGSSPPKVFLSSLDPGMGKTTALIQFLKEVTRSADHVDVGVVVFLSRKEEIVRLVEEAGLHHDDYAVFTSDEGCNGLSPTPVNDAQILFTTQQMLARRSKDTAFARCDPFFYMGRVRAVRVWDETLEPGDVVALSSDELGELLPFLRGAVSTVADRVQDLQAKLIKAASGSIITMPTFEGLGAYCSPSEQGTGLHRSLDKLMAMSGRAVRVFSGQGKQMIALNIRDALPIDMAPLLVLDASGRVRETYQCWQRHRKDLVRLKSAPKDYSPLTIHVLNQGAAKDSWTKNGERLAIEIATVIDSKPTERFLIAHHREFGSLTIRKLILEHLKSPKNRVQFVTWGQHTATNSFGDIPNVVIASTFCLPDWQYSGLAYASAGTPIDQDLPRTTVDTIRVGEHGHHIVQALCRASVRGNDNGQCKPCTAYVIAAKASGIRDKLRDWFPGCQVSTWTPSRRRLQGQKKRAVLGYLKTRRSQDPDAVILFKEVQDAVGIPDKANFRKLRKHPDFRAELEELGLEEVMIGDGKGANAFVRFFHPLLCGDGPGKVQGSKI